MIVVSDTALALGITALPGPVTDIANDGWFFHQPINQRFVFDSATGTQPAAATRYTQDNKAKRIVHDGQAIVIVAENSHAVHGFNLTFALRTLTMIRGT